MELNRLVLPPLTAPGEVVTFYSYKGGTGRSMALANMAVLLAKRQNATVPVLMIDWDMEAPGLHHYFEQHDERPGVLEFFEACRSHFERHALAGAALEPAALARQVLADIDWEQYVVRVDQGSPLYLMRAGRFDASYSERLARMHWDSLFDACPALFRCFADSLARHFRYVLVDSRTGRTDSAGICTTLLPNKLVVVFTPNRQSLEGVQALVTRATEYRRSHEEEQRPLLVYPLPSRIEMGDSEQRAQWRRGDAHKGIAGFQPMFERLLQDAYGVSCVQLDSYFDEVQLQQTKTFAYGEQLAARIDQGGDRFSLTRTFEAFLQWLTGAYFPWQSSQEIHLLARIAEARQVQAHAAGDAGGAGRLLAVPLARDLHRLGELYREEGKAGQALTCLRQALELRQHACGDEHGDTLASKARLAGLLRQMGQLDEARAMEQTVLAVRRRLLGAEHLDTLAAMASLAATLVCLGDDGAALALQQSVLDAYVRQLGAEHPLTLDAQGRHAAMLARLGQLEAARAAQQQLVLSRERLLGAEHPDTLASMGALADTLLHLNQLTSARALLERVVGAHERSLGPDHAATLAARERLAEALDRMGDGIALRLLHEGLVAARSRTLGREHPETLLSQRNLAAVLVQHGELDEARSMLEQVLQAHERVLGVDHLDTLHSKSQLAGALWQQGRQQAAQMLEDAILIASERLLDKAQASQAAPLTPPRPGAVAAEPLERQLSGARGLQQGILARARERASADYHPDALAQALHAVQSLLDNQRPGEARQLADTLRAPLLRPGLAPRLRKRGMALLKKVYKLEGDTEALLALQEDEVLALEGALSEARVQPLSDG